MRKRRIIEKKEAEKNWFNPNKKVLLQRLFGTFDKYWSMCNYFNLLSDEEKEEHIRNSTKMIKIAKIQNRLRSVK